MLDKIYNMAKMVYEKKIKINDAACKLSTEIDKYSKNSHKMYINIFTSMMEGKIYKRGASTDITQYFLEHIVIDYGNDKLLNALKAAIAQICYKYKISGNKSNSIRKICTCIALKNDIDISFDDSIFYDIKVKKSENAWIFQANPKHYDIAKAIDDLDLISWSCERYVNEIKEGDQAYIWISDKESGVIASGYIACDPEIRARSVQEDKYIISCESDFSEKWIADIQIEEKLMCKRISNKMLSESEHFEISPIIKATKEQADILNSIIDDIYIEPKDKIEEYELEDEKNYETYSQEEFLSEVFMDADTYEMLINLIKNKKNIILQGAPGVGKTFASKRLAYSIIGKKDTSRVMMVQFHESYSYEDFILGYRPNGEGFLLTEGAFYKFCKCAEDDIDKDYFFIIDEINRGNLSKIFGELLMLIESDKRGEKVRLLYSNELFCVPKNVHIIGLMNTADRSLAMMDYALRRRFAFFEMEPAFDSPRFKSLICAINDERFSKLISYIKELNDCIRNDESLGDGFRIGHSYFCTDKEITHEWLSSIINYEIIPLIKEYWFDEKDKVEFWIKRLSGVLND